jgi:hypothetical protein
MCGSAGCIGVEGVLRNEAIAVARFRRRAFVCGNRVFGKMRNEATIRLQFPERGWCIVEAALGGGRCALEDCQHFGNATTPGLGSSWLMSWASRFLPVAHPPELFGHFVDQGFLGGVGVIAVLFSQTGVRDGWREWA